MADVAGIVGVSVACGIFGALLAYTRDQRDKALDRVAQLEEERAARESSVDIGEPLVKAADAASADKIARDHNRFVARLLELLSENKRLRSHLERLRGWFVQQETRQLLYASEIDLADEPVMPLAEWIGGTTMTENLAVAVFRKFGAVATEWDPTNHDNQVETWGSMRARMDRAWPRLLAEAGVQETATRPTTLEEINPETQRRSVRRWARVLPVEVPRRIAAAADVKIFGRELKYGEDEGFQWTDDV